MTTKGILDYLDHTCYPPEMYKFLQKAQNIELFDAMTIGEIGALIQNAIVL